ncbi:MAG: M50 family metallopeptidase [bacterium]|nr:M50 family metallopeptidase [bacterium]
MDFLVVIICVFFLLGVTRVLTTIPHELGHAIAGLLLTKEEIAIYIGSYGDPEEGLHFMLGRLKIHFKYNPVLWDHGLCVTEATQLSFIRTYIIVLAGPLASLLLAIVCLYIFNLDVHGAIRLAALLFLVSSVIDFIQNIVPNEQPILLHDGSITYNDGQALRQLRKSRDVYKEFLILREYFDQEEIEKGISLFESTYSKHPDINILRWGIAFYLKKESYERAIELFQELKEKYELNTDEYCNYGLAHSRLGEHQKALELYDESLKLDPSTFYSLNNRGYTLNLLHRYEEAIIDFDKAIEINPEFAYAYNNRGLSKIKLGRADEGLYDIEKSMELDDQNSYAYKNLGIYHKDKGEIEEAMKLFLKAKNLDPETDGLIELITETENEINS